MTTRSAAVEHVQREYDALFDTASHWHERRMPDRELFAEASALVHHEARLLDMAAYGAWLELWHADGLSWLPLRAGAHPGADQSFYLDDSRRRAERVSWMCSPEAWSQSPRLQTVRAVGTVEADLADGELFVRSAVHLTEHRKPPPTQWSGHQFHRFARDPQAATGWRIRHKVIVVPRLAQSAEHPGAVL